MRLENIKLKHSKKITLHLQSEWLEIKRLHFIWHFFSHSAPLQLVCFTCFIHTIPPTETHTDLVELSTCLSHQDIGLVKCLGGSLTAERCVVRRQTSAVSCHTGSKQMTDAHDGRCSPWPLQISFVFYCKDAFAEMRDGNGTLMHEMYGLVLELGRGLTLIWVAKHIHCSDIHPSIIHTCSVLCRVMGVCWNLSQLSLG